MDTSIQNVMRFAMNKLLLKDVLSAEQTSLVSLQELSPVGNAVVNEDGLVTLKAGSGVRTACFTSNEDVLILLHCRSPKHLTLRVGFIDSKGDTHLDQVSKAVSVTTPQGLERFWKSFDAANLAVYRDAHLFFAQLECEEDVSFRIESGIIRQRKGLERLTIYADDLEGIIYNIEKKLAMLEYRSASNTEPILVSPGGKKFMLRVDDDGNLSTTPLVPSKVLFVGNSLLFGMEMSYGMCATKPANDYCHLVADALRVKNPDVIIERNHGARFEQLEDPADFDNLWYHTPTPVSDKPLGASFTPDLDLIIIQLVENVTNEKRRATFAQTIDRFLSLAKQASPKARILWVRSWWCDNGRDTIVEDACRRHRVGCISIGDLYSKETIGQTGQTYLRADGTVAEAPDLWLGHPGDKGMRAIADRIIDYLKL